MTTGPTQATLPQSFVDVVFDGSPSAQSGRFVECEDPAGRSYLAGEWIDRGNGLWALRISLAAAEAVTDAEYNAIARAVEIPGEAAAVVLTDEQRAAIYTAIGYMLAQDGATESSSHVIALRSILEAVPVVVWDAKPEERAAFERYIRSIRTQGYGCAKDVDGRYCDGNTQSRWECWQAALASQVTDSGAIAEAAKWLHATYDRPPQTPECKTMLARIDAALASQATTTSAPTAALDLDEIAFHLQHMFDGAEEGAMARVAYHCGNIKHLIQEARKGTPKPNGYAYLYPYGSDKTIVQFNYGGKMLGLDPIAAVPYYFGDPVDVVTKLPIAAQPDAAKGDAP